MKALLLAAGMGTRLRPLTDQLPKCLMPIRGRPLLEFWISLLQGAGISPLLINLHYMAETVRDYIAQCGYSNLYSVFEKDLLGTGGTLLKNRSFFAMEPTMLVHADNLSFFNVKDFLDAHSRRPDGCEITMMLFRASDPQSCGIVELDTNGTVRAFHEKVSNPPGNLANGAVYIVEPTVYNYLQSLGRPVIDFSLDVIPFFLGRIYTFENKYYHRDIGTVASLAEANLEYNGPIPEGRATAEWSIAYADRIKEFASFWK